MSNQRVLILLKLGGSLITYKSRPYTVRRKVLKRLAGEIAGVLAEEPELKVVIGNGGGSFSHSSAARHDSQGGIARAEAVAEIRDDAARLNRVVVEAMLEAKIPASSYAPSSLLIARDGKINRGFLAPLEHALKLGLVPVVYGDVLDDEIRGASIASTEAQLGYLVHRLINRYRIKLIIQAGVEEGVLDGQGRVVAKISQKNFGQVKNWLGGSAATDVTGGMAHKVEESLGLTELGVETLILNGLVPDRLGEALLGDRPLGTRIV